MAEHMFAYLLKTLDMTAKALFIRLTNILIIVYEIFAYQSRNGSPLSVTGSGALCALRSRRRTT